MESLISESFEEGLLDYPQITRPANFSGLKVPDVLLEWESCAIARVALRTTNSK